MGGIVAQGAFADLFQRLLTEDMLCLAGVLGGGLLVQRATAEILRDRIHAAIVDRPNRMIVRKLSLLSAFEIADLSASAPTLIPRSKSSAVFGLPCIRDQKPLAANRA